ncbi:fimbrial protein [Citrobacter sp. ku-bf4]|uniref:fimbrial protein n=1 Tax=Citrobacter TaxID=544 RepID=UPI00197FB318|nr:MULTISPECIES: fimbrial protein [Citrobacter]MBN6044523.1 fimbrial protein [Citrobacter sp. ku-bf4]MBS0825900.1 fimbrial protein [Citrobacter amalonaticus]
MKKSLLGLAVSAMFVMGAAQAQDVSATLSVTGTVTNNDTGCAINLTQSSVKVNGDITSMAVQGADALPTSLVQLSVTGASASANDVCDSLADEGKLAYRFLGTVDTADGNVLANTNTGEGAATGVGIALYNLGGKVVPVNSGTLPVEKGTTTALGLGLVKLTGQTPVQGSVQGSLTIQLDRL